MALSISAEIEEETVNLYGRLFERVAEDMPDQLARFTKVAGLEVCKSCKARTRKAPKRIPRNEYVAAPADVRPKYITYRRKQKLDTPLHRWSLTRRRGTSGENTNLYFVYSAVKYRRRMGMRFGNYQGIVEKKPDLAAERRELLAQHGGIFHAGLAKASWGWAAKGIFNGATDDISFKKRKRDRRDPRKDVSGETRTWITGKNNGTTEVVIENKLDYIADAMHPGAIDEAARAALKSLYWKVDEYWSKFTQRMELGSEELMTTPTFLDEEFYKNL